MAGFLSLGTAALGRKPPLPPGTAAYVLLETMGQDPEADQQRYETVIARSDGGRRRQGRDHRAVAARGDGAVGGARFAGRMAARPALAAAGLRRERADRRDRARWSRRSQRRSTTRWPAAAGAVFRPRGRRQPARVGAHGRAARAGAGDRARWSTASSSQHRGSISAEHGIGSLKKRVPAPLAQSRGDRPDARHQAGDGSERDPQSRQDLLAGVATRRGAERRKRGGHTTAEADPGLPPHQQQTLTGAIGAASTALRIGKG